MVRPRARAPTCPLAALLSFCPVSRFAPPSPTVRTNLLLSDEVCRRCNLACDRLFTLVVKFLHAPFWRPCTLAPGNICTPLPPLRYASGISVGCHSGLRTAWILIKPTEISNTILCYFLLPVYLKKYTKTKCFTTQ